MLLSFLNYDEDGNADPENSQIIPLVDGGTEGFKGLAGRLADWLAEWLCCCFHLSALDWPCEYHVTGSLGVSG